MLPFFASYIAKRKECDIILKRKIINYSKRGKNMEQKNMTLDRGKIGSRYEIQNMELPLNVAKRLEALGMTYGTQVEVLNNKSKGTLIVRVRGTRFALGKGISRKIEVKG